MTKFLWSLDKNPISSGRLNLQEKNKQINTKIILEQIFYETRILPKLLPVSVVCTSILTVALINTSHKSHNLNYGQHIMCHSVAEGKPVLKLSFDCVSIG